MPRGIPNKRPTLTQELARVQRDLTRIMDRVREAKGAQRAIDSYLSTRRAKPSANGATTAPKKRRKRRKPTAQ